MDSPPPKGLRPPNRLACLTRTFHARRPRQATAVLVTQPLLCTHIGRYMQRYALLETELCLLSIDNQICFISLLGTFLARALAYKVLSAHTLCAYAFDFYVVLEKLGVTFAKLTFIFKSAVCCCS